MGPASPSSSVARIIQLLTEAGSADGHRFAVDDVEDFLAFLLLLRPPAGGLDDAAAALLGRFASRAGVQPGGGERDARAAIDAWFVAHPVNADIVAAVHAIARETLGAGVSDDVGRALGAFAAAPLPTGVLGGGERPKGTVPAGPMARFQVAVPEKKKS